MNCSDFKNNIIFYIDKELEQDKNILFNQHLFECKQCKKLYDKINTVYSNIGDKKILLKNESFYYDVLSKMNSKDLTVGRKFLNQYSHILQMASAIIIGAFSLLLGYLIADSINYESVYTQEDTTQSDIELFANENYFSVNTDDIYNFSSNKNE